MDYLRLIRNYWKQHEEAPFTGNETLLYFRLVDLFNAAGDRANWPESLAMTDGRLCLQTGLSPNTVDKARRALQSRGLIQFQATGKGFRGGATYGLNCPDKPGKSSSISSSKNEELGVSSSESSSKFEELTPEVPQQVPQKDTQNLKNFLRNSYIYNIHTYIPPNPKQKTGGFVVAERNDGDDFWGVLIHPKLVSNQKPQKPPTPGSAAPPPPPKPKADPPKIVNLIRAVVEQNNPGYYWQAKDGASAKELAAKLRNAITQKTGTEPTDTEIIDALQVLIHRTQELRSFFHFTDVPSLNSKFNAILTELRNQPKVQRAKGRPVAPAHRSREQQLDEVAELFGAIDAMVDAKHRGQFVG